MKWNGIRLRGLTFEEVYDIIYDSKFDPQVVLTVYRPVNGSQRRRLGDEQSRPNIEGLQLLSISFSLLTVLSMVCDSYLYLYLND